MNPETAQSPQVGTVSPAFRKRLFTDGDDLFDDMIASIGAARESVELESYIFRNDTVGQRFIQSLCAAARRGLRTRVLLDAFGSLGEIGRVEEQRLREAGVRLRRFHRWQWRSPLRYNRRDHRKLLVVDHRIAYLGGFNIDGRASRRSSGEDHWRDTHVRLEGALARDAVRLFDIFWRGRWRRYDRLRFPANDALASNHTRYGRLRLRHMLDEALAGAEHRIWLTNPYFVPDRPLQRGLMAAARRGVDVRLLLPNKNDVRIARWASHAAYAELFDAGVRVFEYLPRMLHAKTICVDGNWAMVGTSNLDYRSFRHNYEVNLVTLDQDVSRQLETIFLEDLSRAEAVDPQGWFDRPWPHRLAEAIGWAARRWL